MKQIKTIANRLSRSDAFDREVNKALEEGWMLVKRELVPAVDLGSAYQPVGLYAELEKHIIAENEKCCENCKHFDTSASMEPCLSCSDAASNWEEEAAT